VAPGHVVDSLQWAVADSDVIVRGRVIDATSFASNSNSNSEQVLSVTVRVGETLKGPKEETVRFSSHGS